MQIVLIIYLLIAQCFSCSYGYYPSKGFCRRCPSSCNSCMNSSSCLQCAYNYYRDNKTSSCIICNSTCKTCLNSFITCTSCYYGYYLNETTNLCIQCPKSCPDCIKEGKCSSCIIGYYLNITTNLCWLCSNNCKSCTNSFSCTSCYTGYYLNKTNNLCQYCPNGCQNCINKLNCSSCNTGYYLHIAMNQCIICDPNCLHCYQYGCGQCKESFQMDINQNCQKQKTDKNIVIIAATVVPVITIFLFALGIWCYYRSIIRRPQIYRHQTSQLHFKPVVKNKFNILDDCSICLENDCDLITNCNHYYHHKCLKEWTLKQRYCPICRNINLSSINALTCLRCKDLIGLDIFAVNFIENVEKARKDHKCNYRQEQIQHV